VHALDVVGNLLHVNAHATQCGHFFLLQPGAARRLRSFRGHHPRRQPAPGRQLGRPAVLRSHHGRQQVRRFDFGITRAFGVVDRTVDDGAPPW